MAYSWSFFRAGGFDQVQIRKGSDIAHLAELDQKLWVALACPTVGLALDERFLSLLDADNDQRIRAPELLKAVTFVSTGLKNLDDLLKAEEALPLSAINDKTDEGKLLLGAARQVLRNLGKPDATAIALADLSDPTKIFADTPFNGDGVITELSSTEEDEQQAIRDIIHCMGPESDRSGKPGVNQAKVEAFFAEVAAACEWHQQAAQDDAAVLPLGEQTNDAVTAFRAIEAKVDDYFTRCKLAAFDPRVVGLLNRPETEYAELAAKDLSATGVEAAHFPLAQVAADKPLPLTGPVNPAHASALRKLQEAVVSPLLGYRTELREGEWADIRARLQAHLNWLQNQKGAVVEALGMPRLQALHQSSHKANLSALIERDLALDSEAKSLDDVERLVRYYRYLYKLCTNFVSFRDFYDPHQLATFQFGTLYIDQRACTLCMRVEDSAKHASLAGLAGAYLAYLDCVRKTTGEKVHIVAVITDGDSDNIMVGRNGLFYDREGKDYDATITKVIDNPISPRQAFFSPYKKFVRLIEEQVAKRASAADTAATTKLGVAAEGVSTADQTKPPEAKKVDVGAVAALGVAVAGIGTFFTAVMGYASGILSLGLLPTILAFVGLILLISLPSVVLAYVKLRKRNMGPLLDACGWAINSQAKVSVPFGTTLTVLAKLPRGSTRAVTDAYADEGVPWKRWVFLFLVLYVGYRWVKGSFDEFLPHQVTSKEVLSVILPAKSEPTP
jgi:hypothetical protein